MVWIRPRPFELPPPSAAERAIAGLEALRSTLHARIDARVAAEDALCRLRFALLRSDLAHRHRDEVCALFQMMRDARLRFFNRQPIRP